jgi:hypothetical protein
MKQTREEAVRGPRGSTEKRGPTLLSDWTLPFCNGTETRNETQATEEKLHLSLFFSTPYFYDEPKKIIKIQDMAVKKKAYFL